MLLLRPLLLGFLLLLCLPGRSRAQAPHLPDRGVGSVQALVDSLAVLVRYAEQNRGAAVERLTTGLLVGYPVEVKVDFTYDPAFKPGPIYSSRSLDYHVVVYSCRAEFRRRRGDYAGAEADLTRALQYAARDYPYYDGSLSYHSPEQVILRQLYYERARLRQGPLRNPAGACADLAAGYELDPKPAANLFPAGCPPPATRAPLNSEQAGQAWQALADSLGRVQLLLAAGQLGRAEQLLQQLEAGRVGPYAWVRQRYIYPIPAVSPRFLRSELARRRGQYALARAYLDTLLNQRDPQPLHRYALGTLKIDHLGDPAGGCADLRWAYANLPDTTGLHLNWRGCPLPRYRLPSRRETRPYQQAYRDSLSRAAQLLAAGQAAGAERLLTRLINTGEAGGFAVTRRPTTWLSFDTPLTMTLREEASDLRARAYEALADYPRAVAELDTLVDGFPHVPRKDFHCRRAVLRADRLHDQAGACADFAVCYEHRFRAGAELPQGPRRWRGCDIAQRHLGPRLADYAFYQEPVVRLGYFTQGRAAGAELGCYFSPDSSPNPQHGPSAGLEVGGLRHRWPLLAPKLAYDGYLDGIGGRLELGYYVSSNGRGVAGDLRLTPQAGISINGVLNVFYGYSLPLTNARLDGLGQHRLSIYLNFLEFGSFKIGG